MINAGTGYGEIQHTTGCLKHTGQHVRAARQGQGGTHCHCHNVAKRAAIIYVYIYMQYLKKIKIKVTYII